MRWIGRYSLVPFLPQCCPLNFRWPAAILSSTLKTRSCTSKRQCLLPELELVSYCDSHRTSPPASPVKIKGGAVANDSDQSDADARDGSDEDEDASMADFIDDRALDELSEHSESAEEGFSGVDDVDRYVTVW